jgi:cytochrome b involved in lipid metabolism
MALFTFGEGYHNYHHEFQHDYRNGVKPWEWDPTKWLIWSLSKLGLISGLRRARPDVISSSEAKVRNAVKCDQSFAERLGLGAQMTGNAKNAELR